MSNINYSLKFNTYFEVTCIITGQKTFKIRFLYVVFLYCFPWLNFFYLKKKQISTISHACVWNYSCLVCRALHLHVSLQQSVMCYKTMIQTSCLPEWVNISFTNKWTDACIRTPRNEPNTSWNTLRWCLKASPFNMTTWQHFLIISLSNTPQVIRAYLQKPYGETELRIEGERDLQSNSSNVDQRPIRVQMPRHQLSNCHQNLESE